MFNGDKAVRHLTVVLRCGEVNHAMKCPRYRQCLKIVFPLVLLIVIVVTFSVRSPGLNFIHMSVTANTVVTEQPQRIANYGPHNFRRPNRLITEYDEEVARRLAYLVERRVNATDPDLIRLIVDMMDPPTQHMVKTSRELFSTPQSREVDIILNNKRGGFYVECGAFDGERSSNTIHLERQRGWTGLLVEMDPYFYTQLIGKSRRSWSINACLSPEPYLTQLPYIESTIGRGELMVSKTHQSKNSSVVPCFPLHALLLALNQNTVDYLSLDVEGHELEILRTIPFHQINIKVLSVEYAHGRNGKASYVEFMNQQGYDVHKDIRLIDKNKYLFVQDFIFVKKS